MLVRGFDDNPELVETIGALSDSELKSFIATHKAVTLDGDMLRYSLPGLPLCWKCTLKHTGQAVGFAAELDKYPERIACVIGELGHAYRECPNPEVSETLHQTYQYILDTGCVPDLTKVLKVVTEGWRESLAGDFPPHYQV